MEKDELKIRFIKLKLHFIYCGIIFFMIAILLFTTRNYSNIDIAQQLSMGATLVGIVLSVIAIFMSIMGEKDMSSTKDKLVSVSDDLVNITEKLNNSMKDINNVLTIKEEITSGNKKIIEILDSTINYKLNSRDEKIDYLHLFLTNIGEAPDIILSHCVIILYFNIRYEEANKKDISLWDLIKEISKVLNLKEEILAGILVGMIGVYMSEVIANKDFSEYIISESQKYTRLKKLVDDYFIK